MFRSSQRTNQSHLVFPDPSTENVEVLKLCADEFPIKETHFSYTYKDLKIQIDEENEEVTFLLVSEFSKKEYDGVSGPYEHPDKVMYLFTHFSGSTVYRT